MCEPWSRITTAYDKGFLILEVKNIIIILIIIMIMIMTMMVEVNSGGYLPSHKAMR